MTSTVYTYLDAIDDTASELRALSTMLTYTLETGDSLKPSAAGIDGLYRRACDSLENSSQVLRDTIAAERENGLDIKDPHIVATMLGLSCRTVESVIWAACGVSVSGTTSDQGYTSAFIYEQFSRKLAEVRLNDTDIGIIAAGTNVSAETVKKVLDEASDVAAAWLQKEYDLLSTHREYLAKKRAGASSSVEAAPRADDDFVSRHLAEGPIPDYFRAEALAERLSEGVDTAKIAKAVNLKPETVERVIAQLLADPADGNKATGTEG